MANDDKRDKDKEDGQGSIASALLGETLKKVFSVGVSAAFMTEESVRQYLQDLKLPKEFLSVVVQGASKSKDEITNRVSNEIIKIISKVDWVKEAGRFAENHKFKITAEIEVLRKDHGPGSGPHHSETK